MLNSKPNLATSLTELESNRKSFIHVRILTLLLTFANKHTHKLLIYKVLQGMVAIGGIEPATSGF